jgi:hypothetical protein
VTGIKHAVGAFGVLALLAACGGDGDGGDGGDSEFASGSASSIQSASIDDMKSVESMHVKGSVTQQGSELGRDVTLTADGDCVGSITISGANSGSAELISVGGSSWFKPDEDFWRTQAGPQAKQIISKVGDKWVQLPEGDESFGTVCDLDQMLDPLSEKSKSLEKGETEEVDGQDAIKLTRDDAENGGTITTWVAVANPHHIVKVEVEGGDASSSSTFSQFDQDASIEAPADDAVITVEELQQQTQQ